MRRVRAYLPPLLLAPAALCAQVTASSPVSPSSPIDTTTQRVAQAVRREGDIVLDGTLNEIAWQKAPAITSFTQSYPSPGARPTDSTEARILYDDAALYVGVRMFDAHPDSIAAQLARRDASGIYSDWIHVIVDSYHDRRTAFRFTVNPKGVKKDVYTSNDGDEDANWDAIWDVATRVDSAGWVAEFRIPLSQLRFGSVRGRDRIWGFQVMRDVARRNERDSWSPWTPQSPGFVSRFGDLGGLTDVPRPRGLEVVPYASAKLTRAPGDRADPFFHSTDTRPSVGADLKYALPPGLTLTATVNPDFGQVEVDPSVINLSAFETSFPEKRPFFLEGSDALSFGRVALYNDYGSQRFFYSRRIGREPQRSVAGKFVDRPDETTIAVAAKITGKVGPWSVGFLDAVTPEEKARVVTSTDTRIATPVEPLTNYMASRIKRDFRGGGTVVGTMLTSTMRNLADPVFKDILRSTATLAGADFEHAMENRKYILSGFLAGSSVTGSRNAIASTQLNSTHYYQRPDVSYLRYDPSRTRLTGHVGELAFAKAGALYSSIGYKEMSPGLELNDLGFMGAADFRAVVTHVGYQNFTAGKRLRSFGGNGSSEHAWNFGGNSIRQAVSGSVSGVFNNLASVGFGGGYSWRYFNDRFTRGGPLAVQPSRWSVSTNAGSDTRRIVSFRGAADVFRRGQGGGGGWDLSFTADYRPASNVHVILAPSLSRDDAPAQYVRTVTDPAATATYGKRYVFANIHQTTLAMDTRVEWTFTPALSFQLYAQPFVSAGQYYRFKEFLKPRGFEFAEYGVDRGTITRSPTGTYTVDPDDAGSSPSFEFKDPTFNVRNLRGNAVLRWEYRPGSALFVVWQQQRSDFEPVGDFSAVRDVGGIFRTVPTNILLVKATYWMGR
ncbi:MAG: DUF5916 domain-containing protein [Gemmatimonadaceae bacterium]